MIDFSRKPHYSRLREDDTWHIDDNLIDNIGHVYNFDLVNDIGLVYDSDLVYHIRPIYKRDPIDDIDPTYDIDHVHNTKTIYDVTKEDEMVSTKNNHFLLDGGTGA